MVEDEQPTLTMLEKILTAAGYRVTGVLDGLAALKAAHADPPDLVLLDLQLPDIDGIEVMRWLRADPATAGCRIVALSADAMPDRIEAALAAGFDDYWTKPIEFDRFLTGIDALGAELRR